MAGLLLTAAHGDLSGQVRVAGRPVTEVAGLVGLLAQDPQAAIVAETAGRDVAFGLENRRVPRDQIWPRVLAALGEVGFPYGPDRPTQSLSGGEAQRLMLAGSLVLGARVLLLDEPTSMLDPDSADSVRAAVRRQALDHGTTTVIVEHHLEPWLDFADRLVVLGADGAVVADGVPRAVLASEREHLLAQGVWVPGAPAPEPLRIPPELVAPWSTPPACLLEATAVTVRLTGSLADRRRPSVVALDQVDATVPSAHALALTGPSGAGKSTLVTVLAGLLKPTAGEVQADPALATRKGRRPIRWSSRDLAARLSWVAQSPEQAVVSTTVQDEVLRAAQACGRDEARARRRGDALLEALGLAPLGAASPYHLSGGEQRRLMVAAALAHGPFGVLLDEPTVGQDRDTWAAVAGVAAAARHSGAGVVLSTHDRLAVTTLADQVMTLDRGRVLA
jgi:energy-coupling factor transport system ATP-binding protein